MSKREERVKQRREYLKQKGWAYTEAGVTALLSISGAIAAISYFLGTRSGNLPHYWYEYGGVFLVISALGFGLLSYLFAFSARRAHQKTKQLLYIPPVIANTLPAEEVLVRGSEEPAQEQSKVLLRGTDSSMGVAEQELLRSSQKEN